MPCPRCQAPLSPESRFCSSCGLSLEETLAADGEPTAAQSSRRDATTAGASWLSSSSSLDGGFAPGTMLLGRYRIVGLLGQGGMGEVYRADDLTLGQAVALKFLPRDLATNPERLARFHAEVRIARQVSHPNVCRVYDIGDLGGQPFLSMELVDGEDLASLLRRIGRLPRDKAVEIARQICAGLAAAHNTGVLHRDLKPANIMLDRHGKVRLTDFGLAVLHRDGDPHERAGTPVYMSPEQLQGRELTIQSDLYSLGLVLYEMATGKRPHRAETLADLGAERLQPPETPSSLTEDIDPALERVILRCLEPEAARRPASAVAVAAALPGGDPLAAALEAGETPSPEMVAAAGEEGRLRPAIAWGLLGAIVVSLLLILAISSRYFLVNHVPLPKRPAVLEDRAQEILQRLEIESLAADQASGFVYDSRYLNWITRHDPSLTRWETLHQPPSAILFWYRQSPEHMAPMRMGRIEPSFDDPPHRVPGMVRLHLDPSGRLQLFDAVPAEIDSSLLEPSSALAAREPAPTAASAPAGRLPDPERLLFELAGLEPERFQSTGPLWVPRQYCDVRRAWTGHVPGREIPLRVEVGWLGDKLVYFELIGPWKQRHESPVSQKSMLQRIQGIVSTLLVLSLLVGSALVARRHLWTGRGDRRGATRLALFIMSLHMLVWLFVANHARSLEQEFDLFLMTLALVFFLSAIFWVIYLALEPYMRRNWPDLIISWSRLLAGRLRDPLVCRHVLIGVLAGALLVLMNSLNYFLPAWLGIAPRYPERSMLFGATSVLHGLLVALQVLADSIFSPLAIAFLFLGLRWVLRRQWLAAAVVILAIGFIVGIQNDPSGAQSQISIPLGIVLLGVYVFVLGRFGLLALVTLAFVSNFLEASMITMDFSRWYAGSGAVALAIVVALALYSLSNSIGGRPMRRP